MPLSASNGARSNGSFTALGVTVLGAGLAGLSAAARLGEAGCQVEVYDQNLEVGGHARSHRAEGFSFDEGPHVSFTKKPEIQELLARSVEGRFHDFEAEVLNLWRGHWVRHPAQCHLHGLPADVVTRCIVDIVHARQAQAESPAQPFESYEDWCLQGLGRAFSEEFTFRYTRKYWAAEARDMTAGWVGGRMYPPKIEEVVRGALEPSRENFHYISRFRYPEQGGFGAYARGFAAGSMGGVPVHLGHRLVRLDLRRREMEFSNGRTASFEKLVSSLPLPELIACIPEAPAEVREAAGKLVCTSLVLVNVGVRRDEGFPDAHWMYFYDEDIVFSRGHLPHRLAPWNAPSGCGSIQLEVYHSPYRPLPCRDVLGKAMEDLQRVGILRRDDKVLVAAVQPIQYANVLFDHERERNLPVVQRYLQEQGVACCGRYGDWAYHWTDDAILSGRRAAESLLPPALQRSLREPEDTAAVTDAAR